MNIDELRSLHIKPPYYHGLGMIRLIMPDCTLNFHGKLIPPTACYIHNHPRNFTSVCRFGEVKNIYYDYEVSDVETDYILEEIDCIEGTEQRLLHPNVNLIYKYEEIQRAGELVEHKKEVIHDFKCLSDHACTRIVWDRKEITARIIRHKSDDYRCALSNKGEAEESWDIINQILLEVPKY